MQTTTTVLASRHFYRDLKNKTALMFVEVERGERGEACSLLLGALQSRGEVEQNRWRSRPLALLRREARQASPQLGPPALRERRRAPVSRGCDAWGPSYGGESEENKKKRSERVQLSFASSWRAKISSPSSLCKEIRRLLSCWLISPIP